MIIGVYGPKCPEKSGVADYIRLSIPYLERLVGKCHHISNSDWQDPRDFDAVLYHLGNNAFHDSAFRALELRPGPVLLHEYKNLDYYVQVWDALPQSTQEVILQLINDVLVPPQQPITPQSILKGLPIEVFALDSKIESLAMPTATIVMCHSMDVVSHLKQQYPSVDFRFLPHPVAPPAQRNLAMVRAKYGLNTDAYVFGTFGFIGQYKRIEAIFAAWESWPDRPNEARLIIVGDSQYPLQRPTDSSISFTGYVSESDFESLADAIDCGIQLRYPSLGETSGSISRLVAHCRPVIISNIPEMNMYRRYTGVNFVSPGPSEPIELREAMISRYQLGRSPLAYRREFSWDAWSEVVRQVLRPGGAHEPVASATAPD